jgi:hypothetical protein
MNTNKKVMAKHPKESSHNKHIKKPHEHNHKASILEGQT